MYPIVQTLVCYDKLEKSQSYICAIEDTKYILQLKSYLSYISMV